MAQRFAVLAMSGHVAGSRALLDQLVRHLEACEGEPGVSDWIQDCDARAELSCLASLLDQELVQAEE